MSRYSFRSMAVLVLAALAFVPVNASARADAAPVAAPLPELRDTWESQSYEQWRIGYCHTHREYVEENGETLVRVETVEHQELTRLGAPLVMDLHAISYQTLEGALVRFEIDGENGMYDRAFGEVVGDQLRLTIVRSGEIEEQIIDCPGGICGLSGMQPLPDGLELQPGDVVKLRMLETGAMTPATVQITAEEYEETELPGGVTMPLLRVRMEGLRPNAVVRAWINELGEVLKTYSDEMGFITYRVTEEIARHPLRADQFDFQLEVGIVVIEGSLPAGPQTTEAEYLVTVEDGEPADWLVAGPTQAITRVDGNTVRLVVRAISPETPGIEAEPLSAEQLREYLEPNAFLQSDHPAVAAMAREAAGDETDPWLLAVRLEQFVERRMTYGLAVVFASAAEVCESLEGDCSEHALLLAALLRANDIPSRVVCGLLHGGGSFCGHFWTEAYIDGVWIPLDGTLGRAGIGADHIALSRSSLADASLDFTSAVVVIRRLDIEVLRAEPRQMIGTVWALDESGNPARQIGQYVPDGIFEISLNEGIVLRCDTSGGEPYHAAADGSFSQVRCEYTAYDTDGIAEAAQWTVVGRGELLVDLDSLGIDGVSFDALLRQTHASTDGVNFVEVEEEFRRLRFRV